MARRSEKGHDVWTVADAKARLSEVIERAQGEPQVITRNGKPSAIVVSVEEWARKAARKGTLAEFLLNSPLRGAELDLERLRDEPRDLGFCSIPTSCPKRGGPSPTGGFLNGSTGSTRIAPSSAWWRWRRSAAASR